MTTTRTLATLMLAATMLVAPALSSAIGTAPAFAGGGGGSGGGGNGGGGHGGGGGGIGGGLGGGAAASADTGRDSGNDPGGKGGKDGKGDTASSLGGLNAAHASPNALEHASPNSRVGKVDTYADDPTLSNLQAATNKAKTVTSLNSPVATQVNSLLSDTGK